MRLPRSTGCCNRARIRGRWVDTLRLQSNLGRQSEFLHEKKSTRGKVDRKTLYGTYYCSQRHAEAISPECPRTICSKLADGIVWDKVAEVLNNPAGLIASANKHIQNIRSEAEERLSDKNRIEQEMDAMQLEHQWIITQARKGNITEDDMDQQLGQLTLQESTFSQELGLTKSVLDLPILDNWEQTAREYLETIRRGLDSLKENAAKYDQGRHDIFKIKRQIVATLVEKIDISSARELKATFRLDLLALLDHTLDFSEVRSAETCTRRLACHAHPHPSAVCG